MAQSGFPHKRVSIRSDPERYPSHMAVLSRVRLIVNADDFGLTPGINRAVAELAGAGALTSATLMASARAFDDAVARAALHPSLSTGCHVVLVDGTPCASRGIPSLRGADGRLHDSLPSFVFELQGGRISEGDIQREAVAQIQHVQSTGLRVTHVDTHKHTHLFPRVARPLLRAAVQCGVGAIRNPFEPAWSTRLTRGALLRKIEVTGLRGFQDSFLRLCREFGVRTTDGSIGVSVTGKLDAAALRLLLQEAPPGTWELVCHPGYQDAALDAVKTRLRHTREIEREALLDQIPGAVRRATVQAVSFSDL